MTSILSSEGLVPALPGLMGGLLYLPPLFVPLLGLEKYNTKRKYFIHFALALGLIVLGCFSRHPAALAALALFYLEVGARVLIRAAGALFPARFSDLVSKCVDLSCYGDPLETRIQGHPFLQFTGRIGKPAGFQRRGAYGDYGFVGISARDVAKPEGVVRIACLGGSTTEYGYPALLQEVLRKRAPERNYQVLNFGLSWWTTIHSVVNYVLNVRDFKPDFVVIHHNVNDHKYRGYGHWRGDGAHAFVPWHYRGAPDRYLIHFSVLYRFLRLRVQAIHALLPKFGDFPEAADKYSQILQRKGKSTLYSPNELEIYRRNVETIVNLAKIEGSKVVLTTMPYSEKAEGEVQGAIMRHMIETNRLVREIAAKHALPLVDLEKTAAEESFFVDMVHMAASGDRKKAEEIGECLLSEMKDENPR